MSTDFKFSIFIICKCGDSFYIQKEYEQDEVLNRFSSLFEYEMSMIFLEDKPIQFDFQIYTCNGVKANYKTQSWLNPSCFFSN